VAGLSALGLALGACEGREPRCEIDDEDLPASVSDGFDRPDGPIGRAESGQAWDEAAGSWSVLAGRARATPAFRSQVCTALVEAGSADGRLDVVLTLSPTPRRANAGAVFRSVDAETNLFVKLERTPVNPAGMLAIGRKEAGRVSYLARRTSGIGFENGDTVRLVIELDGPEVGVRVSTCEELEHVLEGADLDAFAGLTRHGLRVNAAPDDDDGGSTFEEVRFHPLR
jgi:hypothetical protein